MAKFAKTAPVSFRKYAMKKQMKGMTIAQKRDYILNSWPEHKKLCPSLMKK